MADLEDVTLDGRPLQSLRVADLKAALEERGLSKSGQKNALIKRLKGALMLENLQRTSTAHIGLQPNSQIGEEMSQNSFIKQYLAKQQELLRQRLEREAREAYDTNEEEDHTEVNNSTSCPPQAQDATAALAEQHKPPGPSGGEGFFGAVNEGEGNRSQDADMSGPPASGSVAMRIPGSQHRPERGSVSNEVAADSDDDDSEDAEEDGDDDDWENGARRRSHREPARMPTARERSGASCQPPQQHMPSLLSPQLRQPTPPPSPPPELSFPLPDTPKQSPPSPDVAPARRSPSTSSSGSSSSGSRSSSPEPQRSGHAERKPGPLTLLARKMESEGAFSGAGWHHSGGEGDRQESSSPATSFPGRGPPEGLVSAITHTANTAGHVSFPMIPGANQGVTGTHSAHLQVPVSVLKATATEERDRERDSEIEREKALELERQEKQRKLEQERAMEEERKRALALERERALEKERIERQQALEREEREKALQRERELALERERQERELALAKEREEREQALARERALELERQKELERQRALEQERLQREKEERERREREEMERVMELERAKALEQERKERERALEQERLERERALEAERMEKERIEREKALEQERLERERLEREKALEQERLERERALEQERLEQERLEREKALEQERLERERALEQERLEREKALEQERLEREKALEQERLEREKALEQERLEREKVLEQERLEREKALEQERLERERALEKERLERERALEKERLEQERLEREKALEQERLERDRIEREKALEQERLERERALEQERLERERALEQQRLELERKEKERIEREKALEQERIEREEALEREKEEKERLEREAALEQQRKEKERAEKERKERLEREKALEQEKLERERALEKESALKLERLEKEKAVQKEKEEQERALEQEKERARVAEKERESHLPPSKRGREIGLTPLPTPPPLSTGPGGNSSTEAGEQEGVHAPMSQGEGAESGAPMSSTPLSPQSSFKKFRFFRDSPVQTQSSNTSIVIKRPRNFSDTPQPRSSPVSSLSEVGQQQQEGLKSSAEHQDPQMQTKQEDVARALGSLGAQLEKETTLSTTPSPKKGGAMCLVLEDKEKDLVKMEQAANESTKKSEVDESKAPSSPVDAVQQRGRDEKKDEKQKRRSSSNDSSSSESDSGSSSSGSSGSSSSSREKTSSTSRGRREEKPSPKPRVTLEAQAEDLKETQKALPCKRDMSAEKSNATVDGDSHTKIPFNEAPTREETKRQREDSEEEEETDKQSQVKETAMAESEKLPETGEETPKAFSARKISISSTGSAEGEQDSGATAGRKRRWGSSTAVTAKKPSISITTDSLKSLIPDIRPCLGQEAVVDLHPEEAVLSGAEDEERERSDQDLQIRRTVTQVVHSESQENGQKEAKRSRHEEVEEDDQQGDRERTGAHEEKMDTSFPGAIETQSPSHTSHDVEINTVTPSDTLIRRSISQQKTGVSITIDDPVRTARQPSPPRGKVSNIVHICNLVRPFTLGQLKELLSRTGTLVEEGFWIDKIKSHCYVTYCSSEEAVATRAALHGVKWPQSNPKVLSVDFCQQDELDFHKGLGAADRPGAEDQGPGSGRGRTSGLPSLLPERDQWAEREREMERRERARAEREWDRDKVREFGKPGEEKEGGPRRSRSRERRRKERGKSKEKKTEKKEKTAEDPPAKLLDDLFLKTKAAPCIYWLPLTEEQFVQREAARAERMKEREKRRKELDEEEEKKKEEERKERMKAGSGPTGERSEGEKERERDRERDRDRDRGRDRDRERERENDKRRDGYRRPEGRGAGGGRRSRSRSDPRERRR
ncbi:apoptotic chromatin condensation inducer in the nucleus isoform X1 [Plectropomus leopardus]|uniref:apoptotic chromatin condensation inducer in the nucleus isoform X1 n=1 Tax=Plectropomus leopardus TaxID=160734 RepID=UPI001C4BAE06|nr:apoptotic chromatin condensation inducer in the nucleus isoform X1 [Plectropomus leopardus]